MPILNPNPPEFPSVWANSYGQDQFGLWQGLALNGVRQVMRWIPPGRFVMGSPTTEKNRRKNETQHEVLISRGFWLGDTACTQALWQAVMEDNPSHFKNNPEYPVDSVSWNDCQRFIKRANEHLSGEFTLRLPTEVEWEYAARAGSESTYWWGDDISHQRANYDEHNNGPVDVLQYDGNDFGLFQVHGNIWEWCHDWYGEYSKNDETDPTGPGNGQYRVLRGGGWFYVPQLLRAALRLRYTPGSRSLHYGLRLAGG